MSDTALSALGLSDTASPDDVKRRWRELAREHHPDRGGTAEAFYHWNRLTERAAIEAEASLTCTNCNGTGRWSPKATVSFARAVFFCPPCKGTGKVARK